MTFTEYMSRLTETPGARPALPSGVADERDLIRLGWVYPKYAGYAITAQARALLGLRKITSRPFAPEGEPPDNLQQ